MEKQTKQMLSALSSGIDLTKPTLDSLHNTSKGDVTAHEIRKVKASVVNLINILLEED